MAAFSAELAEELIRSSVLGELVASMRASTLPGHLKACSFVLRCVGAHSAHLAAACLDLGAAPALVHALSHTDSSVREAAAVALAAVVSHSPEAAADALEAGVAPLLVAALGEPEPALRRAAAAACADVAKHAPELAAALVDAGALIPLVSAMRIGVPGAQSAAAAAALAAATAAAGAAGAADVSPAGLARVRRAATSALCAFARHTPALAEAVVLARAFPLALVLMRDTDVATRAAAASLVREVVKHSETLAATVAEAGGVGSCVEFLGTVTSADSGGGGVAVSSSSSSSSSSQIPGGVLAATLTITPSGSGNGGVGGALRGTARLPAVMALGYIAAYSEPLAAAVVAAAGVSALRDALTDAGAEEHARSAAVWALGQVGKHSAACARAIANADILRLLLALASASPAQVGDDVREKARRALLAIVSQCDAIPALVALIPACPPREAVKVLAQLAALLGTDAGRRRDFLASGALKLIQRADPAARAASATHGSAATREFVANSALASGATSVDAFFAPPFATTAFATVAAGAPDVDLEESVAVINDLFPADVVAHCRPDYGLNLLARAANDAKALAMDAGGKVARNNNNTDT